MPYRTRIHPALILVFGLLVADGFVHAQQQIYENESVVVFSIPTDLTAENTRPLAQEIALAVARKGLIELGGQAVTVLAGSVAGVIYSVVQQIPSVGNPTRVTFDVISQRQPLVASSRFGLTLLLDTGDCVRGTSVALERRRGLFGWESLETRTLLSTDEMWNVLEDVPNTRMILVTRDLLTAPETRGTYRITISAGCTTGGWSKLIDVMEVY